MVVKAAHHFAFALQPWSWYAEQGNILFDIVGVLDDTTKQKIKNLGGLHAIYFSHPHYYGT